jgi:hypothetical protein
VLSDIRQDLKLFTLRVSCEFFTSLEAFDSLAIRMRLEELTQTQIAFSFDYVRLRDERLAAGMAAGRVHARPEPQHPSCHGPCIAARGASGVCKPSSCRRHGGAADSINGGMI